MFNFALIKLYLNKSIKFVPLENAVEILDNQRKPISSTNRVKGEFPYYGANGIQDYVDGYLFDGKFVLVGEDGSVINENGCPIVNWAEGKIWVNNHAHVLSEKEGFSLRFIYHYIQTIDISNLVHGNIPKLTGKDIKNLKIPKLPLEVQCEIVRILDNFAELTAELTAELSLRKSQAEYYKNLFIISARTSEKKLIDISEMKRGSSATKLSLKPGDVPVISGGREPSFYCNISNRDKDIITVAGSGAGAGYVQYWDKNIYANDCFTIKGKEGFLTKYLYYCLSSMQDKIYATKKGGGVPHVHISSICDFIIPVCDVKTQITIVNTLNNFEMYIANIKNGLPAEIKLRQQQYEYYRDKLLSFKDINGNN